MYKKQKRKEIKEPQKAQIKTRAMGRCSFHDCKKRKPKKK